MTVEPGLLEQAKRAAQGLADAERDALLAPLSEEERTRLTAKGQPRRLERVDVTVKRVGSAFFSILRIERVHHAPDESGAARCLVHSAASRNETGFRVPMEARRFSLARNLGGELQPHARATDQLQTVSPSAQELHELRL